jgi:SAM-dependent methyltransferase
MASLYSAVAHRRICRDRMNNFTPDWTEGYIAEVEYTAGFYQELSPSHLAFATLLAGFQAPAVDQPFTYCELGCGKGVTVNLIAAANPQGRFYANDFNPAHIVHARGLAAEAGLDNLTVLEKSFTELGQEALPDFDYIALHGIYSWVSAENQRAIVEFIRRKLKPGGVVYVSYNCLPGWAAAAPLRHLMHEYAARQSGTLPQRIKAAIEFAQGLGKGKAKYFTANPGVGPRLDRIAGQAPNYLVHEYLNKDWTLLYHAELVQHMAAAKLSYAGSATIIEQFDDLLVKAEARAAYKDIADPVMRETVKDFVLNQQFRRDVFTRGAPRLNQAGQLEAAGRLRFALRLPRASCAVEAKVPVGTMKLSDGYLKILDALAEAPRSVPELVADPKIASLGGGTQVIRALAVLVAVGYVAPGLPPQTEALARRSTARLNDVILARMLKGEDLGYLATPVLGNGIAIEATDRLFLTALRQGERDPATFAWSGLKRRGQVLIKDGKALSDADENKAELARRLEQFSNRQLPVLRQLGVAAAPPAAAKRR